MLKFVSITLLMVVSVGCSSENPLCTDNYCLEGTIFAKSDLEEDQIYEVLPIDESALIAAIEKATTDEATTDAGMEERAPRTEDEWTARLKEQDHIPALSPEVLEFVLGGNALRIQIADRAAQLCVSLNNEEIRNKTYTCHGSVWARTATKRNGDKDLIVLDSTIKIGEICGLTDLRLIIANTVNVEYLHRIFMDMTIDGERMFYVTDRTISRNP